MTTINIFSPSSPDFRIEAAVLHDVHSLIRKIQEPIDLVLMTNEGGTMVIPQKLKETFYFIMTEHAES